MEDQSAAKRLKILFITEWYPTSAQPVAGVFVREHAKAVQLRNDVVVLHCAGSEPALKRLWRLEPELDARLAEGIPTYRVWRGRLRIRRVGYLLYLWSVLQAFRRIVAGGFRPDVIHGHIYEAGAAAVMVGRLYGIPVAVTEHSTSFPRRSLRGLDVWKPRLTFRWADRVLPVSRTLQQAIEVYGIRACFRIVPNVVDTDMFAPCGSPHLDHPRKRFLFVGALESTHRKGVPYLFEALAGLRPEQGAWHLAMVGDGPARGEYERLAAALGISGQVDFHGEQSKRDVAEFMRQADIFVLPSIWENLPCVVIEAMASGLPIVASRVGGIPELVDQTTGRLVPPADAPSLAAALAEMLDALPTFDRQAIARKAGRFSPGVVGGCLDTIYRELLRR